MTWDNNDLITGHCVIAAVAHVHMSTGNRSGAASATGYISPWLTQDRKQTY